MLKPGMKPQLLIRQGSDDLFRIEYWEQERNVARVPKVVKKTEMMIRFTRVPNKAGTDKDDCEF